LVFFSENTKHVPKARTAFSIHSNELTGALQSHSESMIDETSSAVNNTYNGNTKQTTTRQTNKQPKTCKIIRNPMSLSGFFVNKKYLLTDIGLMIYNYYNID
jgi:hypothetical protein